ncbi:cell division protein FtsQ [Arthrobacter sp. V4I6]|uniref:FtsQ-type POTRA domain-containing protein n=1 Tax=unclassified Arthrobacter TaxID=235627 RepID=UPI00277EBED5|nr:MULTISPECIES: FtsQ-type POTRA domain-containing protein [unclassified Arthrobacter]MDQ0821763.1 cell division protein FtsQ [Arthrobacter sp. V1I7]MDQ0856027.1 cell division protein FtsQ [Arthrobacter sp. V4I6]
MVSTRRPTYKTGARRSRPDLPDRPDGTPTDVISASRAEPGPGTPSVAPGAAETQQDNILSFPEPKAKRRKRIVLSTIGVIAALVAAIVLAAVYTPLLALRTVTVEGTKLLSAEQVQAALAPLQGKPLPQIGDEDVTALLQPLVQIKAVTIQARPPATLAVRITERVPVAKLKQRDGLQLVDVEGIALSATTGDAPVALPVIDAGEGVLAAELFHAITGVLGALPADVLARLSDASAKSADAVELKLVDGQTIIWGNAGEKELKARVLAALLKVPADPKNPVRIYDVSVPRHPVTR